MWESSVYENQAALTDAAAGSAHETVYEAISTGAAFARFARNVALAPHGRRVRAARTSTVAGLTLLVASLGGPMGQYELYDLICELPTLDACAYLQYFVTDTPTTNRHR